MDISAIIQSLVSAKKIGAMTLAAIFFGIIGYLFNEKTDIIKSEDKVGALFIFIIIAFLLIVVLGFLFAIAIKKMGYEHENSMKGQNIDEPIVKNNKINESDIKPQMEKAENKVPSSHTVNQHGQKSIYIETNSGTINN